MRVNIAYLIVGFIAGVIVSGFIWLASKMWPEDEKRRKDMFEE